MNGVETRGRDDAENGAASLRKPEVLAPAGNWECARAAIENGADAIYFGLSRFNARMRAGNFTEADLPELMAFLHKRGAKGYLTFNTLVFEDELEDAREFLRSAISNGVDAAIVQDVGVCRLIRELSPDFPIHASTQMTITSDAGVELARELGASLVVLARECSISEIELIRAALGDQEMPLEVFVHGALCVAYSGQCLTSEALGGRSANRGECAQACRLPYDMYVDGEHKRLDGRKYLLSPQDLAGVPAIPYLVRAGVSSLKIEGRLKTPEYVANITRVYRDAVDKAFEELNTKDGFQRAVAAVEQHSKASRYQMEMAFSRGLYTGWLNGIDNQRLVHAQYPKKRGVLLGKVVKVEAPKVLIEGVGAPVKRGDGVVFDLGQPEEKEAGGFVSDVNSDKDRSWLHFHYPSVNWKRVRPGAKVWKTSDPELDRRLRETFTGSAIGQRRPITFIVHGEAGQPLTLECRDELGHVVVEVSNELLQPALNRPLSDETLAKQLGRLGETPFELGKLENRLGQNVILPVKELNDLRRRTVDALLHLRAQPPRWTLHENPLPAAAYEAPPHQAAELLLLVRDLGQLEAVLPLAHRDIYAEFEDPKKYRTAMAQVREYREQTGKEIHFWAAPPRVFKMKEDWILKIVGSSEPDGILVRNAEHLRRFEGLRKRGDFSLNVSNRLAAEYFLERWGLESLTASYDLNVQQLSALLTGAPAQWFEVTLHQRMPMFHMEHCVFCAFLSEGKDYHDCGRPCEKHRVRLKDRFGAEHYLRADAGCRNTLFNAKTQTGADYAQMLMNLGVRRFRLEFLEEGADEIRTTVDRYERLLRGELDGEALWKELKLTNQLGVTRGTLASAGRLQQ